MSSDASQDAACYKLTFLSRIPARHAWKASPQNDQYSRYEARLTAYEARFPEESREHSVLSAIIVISILSLIYIVYQRGCIYIRLRHVLSIACRLLGTYFISYQRRLSGRMIYTSTIKARWSVLLPRFAVAWIPPSPLSLSNLNDFRDPRPFSLSYPWPMACVEPQLGVTSEDRYIQQAGFHMPHIPKEAISWASTLTDMEGRKKC